MSRNNTGARVTATSTVDKAYHSISALIANSQLSTGSRIPSEKELSDQLGISRSSLREALSRLEQEGTLSVVQGQGRFISSLTSLKIERPMTKYESITDMLEGMGYSVSTAVLEVEECEADENCAKALETTVGAPMIRLLRIRFGDNQPLIISENFVPRNLLPGPLQYRDWGGSLAAMLAAHGNYIESALATIRAANMPEDWERKYTLEGMNPWLLVNEVGLTKSGTPVLWAYDYHRSPEITFTVLRQR